MTLSYEDASVAIATNLNFPRSVVVYDASLAWTIGGDVDYDGELWTSELSGASPRMLASALAQPRGLAANRTFIYWVNRGDGTVHRVRWDGTGSTELVSGTPTPNAIALDSERVYWTEAGNPPDYVDGAIRTAKLDGSDVRTLATSQPYPIALALDDEAVYFAVRGTFPLYDDGAVRKVAKP
jgi:hypothetical protein